MKNEEKRILDNQRAIMKALMLLLAQLDVDMAPYLIGILTELEDQTRIHTTYEG